MSLAADVNERTGIEATAIPGARGQFDVLLDGRLLFSKGDAGRFPEPEEIVAELSTELA